MKRFTPVRLLAAATLVGGLLATTPALAQDPDATIHFGGQTLAFLGSVQWGGGHLHYHGRDIALKVNGISVGAIGWDKFSADGEVFHLHHADDINGTYTALSTSATAGVGQGGIDMQNEHGVEIRAHTTSSGLALSLAPGGVKIQIR
jgi:hypothetical protein